MKVIPANKELDILLEEHKSFVGLMGDIAGCSISEAGWSRVRTYLSPASKFDVSQAIMMTPVLISKVSCKIKDYVIYQKRQLIKLYITYDFPDYENAACFEFLLRGASLNIKQPIEREGVIHQIRIDADDPNKIYGVISVGIIEKSESADTFYEAVLSCLQR